jgi:dienelactone hydrolase
MRMIQARHRVGRGLALLAALTTLASGASAGRQNVDIPTQHIPLSRLPDGNLSAVLIIPDGRGPFPAVILLHGCGGLSSNQTIWANRVRDWGYAALILDSFAARGVRTVCAPSMQPLVTPRDRAGDVLSAALYLRTLPMIDGARIAVLGNSHGGATAAFVTRREYDVLYPGLLAAAVDYYGPCRSAVDHGHVPLLALAGEADDWGSSAQNCRAFGAALRPDQPFEIFTYPDVVHAFDNPANSAMSFNEGHKMHYDYGAATDSYERVRAFLDKWVRHKPPPG